MTIKDKILTANKAYRIGRPIMSDIEFDKLCEEYEQTVSAEEYSAFRDSLHEETGKVKHPYIMGSLDKLKIEEPKNIIDWLIKYNIKLLNITAKVDGISCRLHYNQHGALESATSRGDGMYGNDMTDKVRHVKYVPYNIKYSDIDVRGELVITNKDFEPLADSMKNARNACAGIMGQKDVDENLLHHVSFIAYEIMGGKIEKHKQFEILRECGFRVVDIANINISNARMDVIDDNPIIGYLTKCITHDYDYPTDGVVVSSYDYKAEQDVYRPKAQKAVKISNLISAKSKLIDVVWERPSKNGRITPVGIIDPVKLYGAEIRRVTLNNIDWINKMQLKIGSIVTITRSNGVIPKIIDVTNNVLFKTKDIELPTACPSCGGKLQLVGVDICCKNANCGATGYAKIRTFINNLGIKHVSLKTIENLGIDDFGKLLAFKADRTYKIQARFENDLGNKLFGADEQTIFKALPFKNVAEKTLDKIIDFYGFDWLRRMFGATINNFWTMKPGFPVGVGEKILESFSESAGGNFLILDAIMKDDRWHGKKIENKTTIKHSALKGTVCFTGKLNNFSRKTATEYAKQHGFDVLDGVSRELTYLITNSKDMTSKMKNAIKYGTKVITEDEFMKMCE